MHPVLQIEGSNVYIPSESTMNEVSVKVCTIIVGDYGVSVMVIVIISD